MEIPPGVQLEPPLVQLEAKVKHGVVALGFAFNRSKFRMKNQHRIAIITELINDFFRVRAVSGSFIGVRLNLPGLINLYKRLPDNVQVLTWKFSSILPFCSGCCE